MLISAEFKPLNVLLFIKQQALWLQFCIELLWLDPCRKLHSKSLGYKYIIGLEL